MLLSIVLPIATQWRKHGRLSEAFKDLWSRRLHLAMFYACIALASLAKGLLGFLLPGAILFLFLLVTWNWRLISRLQLLRGVGVFICVGFPWYVAMFAVHGMAFYSRFFVHDHFNRFASGVHQVDTGLFEHFIKWLGLGMFPWAALVPVVLIPLMRLRRIPKTRRARLIVLLFVWTFFSYFLFTRSSTKFHHYIFPALIPLGVLIGLWLRDLPRLPSRWVRLAAVCGIGLVVSMGWTVHDDKQAIRNLMTYKYDRPLAKSLPVDPGAAVSDVSKTTWEDSRFFKETPAPIEAALTNAWGYYPNVIRAVGGLVLLGFLLWLISTSPAVLRAGTYMLGTGAMILAVWSLSVYMPMLSPAWSQKYIFDEYYARCSLLPNTPDIEDAYTPLVRRAGLGFIADMTGARPKQVCDEDIMAWLFTWRGETFYSNNEILPVAKAEHMKDYLKEFNNGKPFFAVLEIHRRSSFESSLNRESKALRDAKEEPFAGIEKWDVELAHAENPYFVLVHARPVAKTAKQPATATAPGATP